VNIETAKVIAGVVALVAPALLLAILGFVSLLNGRLSEKATGRLCQVLAFVGLVFALGELALMLDDGDHHVEIVLGNWVAIPEYHFTIKFVFDRLSVPLTILSFLLCGTIGGFATRYMHRESGYNRFFVLFALFQLGMIVASLAGTIETLFVGWELVGLSSALLVAYFQDRAAPPRNGLRIWIVYRISDAALLLAAVVMHHVTGEGDFDRLFASGEWPHGTATISTGQAFAVGLLLLIAVAGKSGLIPFSGWLPRAMEGPTPSSAVFYGALSIHLGVFLLLRAGPIIDTSIWLSGLVILLGLGTAVFAYLVGSVQTDVKSALCFASLAQVGIIVVEIGLGWRYIPLIHLLGHACLRTLQFVRAPMLLQDYRRLENAMGASLPRGSGFTGASIPAAWRVRAYRFAMERGHFDALIGKFVVGPFIGFFRWCESVERRWTEFLSGAKQESEKGGEV
jgi:NADH-quinone oxidoreductase subunit L